MQRLQGNKNLFPLAYAKIQYTEEKQERCNGMNEKITIQNIWLNRKKQKPFFLKKVKQYLFFFRGVEEISRF